MKSSLDELELATFDTLRFLNHFSSCGFRNCVQWISQTELLEFCISNRLKRDDNVGLEVSGVTVIQKWLQKNWANKLQPLRGWTFCLNVLVKFCDGAAKTEHIVHPDSDGMAGALWWGRCSTPNVSDVTTEQSTSQWQAVRRETGLRQESIMASVAPAGMRPRRSYCYSQQAATAAFNLHVPIYV